MNDTLMALNELGDSSNLGDEERNALEMTIRANLRAPLPKIEGLEEAIKSKAHLFDGTGLDVFMKAARAYLKASEV